VRILVAGCGAVGSQTAWHIAHPDHIFVLVDDDRIEDHNVNTGTSIYSTYHVGMLKTVALAELLWRKCNCHSILHNRTLETPRTIARLNPDLVIDGFDNSEARELTHGLGIPTVHVGVSEARTGDVTWDERYRVPQTGMGRNDVNASCTHALGRQILRFTSAVAAGIIERWIETGEKRDLVVTEGMTVLK